MTVPGETNTRPGKGKATTEAGNTSDTAAVLSDQIILQRALFFRQLSLMKSANVNLQNSPSLADAMLNEGQK